MLQWYKAGVHVIEEGAFQECARAHGYEEVDLGQPILATRELGMDDWKERRGAERTAAG